MSTRIVNVGSLLTFAVSGSADCDVAMFVREVHLPVWHFEVEVATIVVVKLPPDLTRALSAFASGKTGQVTHLGLHCQDGDATA